MVALNVLVIHKVKAVVHQGLMIMVALNVLVIHKVKAVVHQGLMTMVALNVLVIHKVKAVVHQGLMIMDALNATVMLKVKAVVHHGQKKDQADLSVRVNPVVVLLHGLIEKVRKVPADLPVQVSPRVQVNLQATARKVIKRVAVAMPVHDLMTVCLMFLIKP
jgi:hypothetical protein